MPDSNDEAIYYIMLSDTRDVDDCRISTLILQRFAVRFYLRYTLHCEHEHWWSPAAGDSSQQAATSEKHCGFLLMDTKWNANIDSATNTFGDMSSHCTSIELVHSVKSGKMLNFDGMTVSIWKQSQYGYYKHTEMVGCIVWFFTLYAEGQELQWLANVRKECLLIK